MTNAGFPVRGRGCERAWRTIASERAACLRGSPERAQGCRIDRLHASERHWNYVLAAAFGHLQHFTELDHSRERRAPVSKQRKVVDKPTQRLVDLIESANRDHQLAEGKPAAEICGRRDGDRSDN